MQQFYTFLRANILLAVFGLVGASGLAAALYFSYDTLTFLQNATPARGVVSAIRRHAGNSTSPVIQFHLPNGKRAEYVSKVESSTEHFTIGEEVRMLYLPSDPSGSARIDDIFELWLLPIVLGSLGVVFGGIPVGIWLYDRRSAGAKAMTLQERMEEVKKNNRMNSNRVESTAMSPKLLMIFPSIGIILLLLAGFFAWKHYRFMQTAPQFTAVVIANEWRGKTFYPVYEFIDNLGDTVHAYSSMGMNPPMFAIGESAEIYYDPHDQSAEAKGFFSEWFVVLILGFIGTLFTGIGMILLRVFR